MKTPCCTLPAALVATISKCSHISVVIVCSAHFGNCIALSLRFKAMSSSSALLRVPKQWGIRNTLCKPSQFTSSRQVSTCVSIRIPASQVPAKRPMQVRLLSTTVEEVHLKPAARLEELRRVGLTPYPRYQPPPIPLAPIRDLVAQYQDTTENGTKDLTKKFSINGKTPTRKDTAQEYGNLFGSGMTVALTMHIYHG